jgi:nucleoside-diphosphate-sugar epimerase
MIVGQGLLARAFAPRYIDDPGVTIFASGVSNSSETAPEAFERERALLVPLLDGRTRVAYFGSCASAMGDASAATAYMRHKRAMADLVAGSPDGVVLRLPQVVGFTPNPNTLTNFLRDRILSGAPFSVWANAKRNLIDVEDVASIGTRLIDTASSDHRVFSVASADTLSMPDLVAIFERVLGRKASCTVEPVGSPLRIDATEAISVAAQLGIDMGPGYAENVIRKYYAPPT